MLILLFACLGCSLVVQAQITYAKYQSTASICPNFGEKCIGLYNCGSVLSQLKSHRITLKEMREITCGFQGRTPKVCCPSLLTVDVNAQVVNQGSNNRGNTESTIKPTQTLPIERTTPQQKPVLLSGAAPEKPTNQQKTNKPDVSTVTEKQTLTTPTSSQKPDIPVTNNTIIPQEILPSGCGISYAILKVFGGKTSEPGAWPWLAALQFQEGGETPFFACGGALIHKRYVLTAAHCIKGKKGLRNLIGIRLGDHDLVREDDDTEPQNFVPEEIIPHEEYNAGPRHNDDIALIKLDRDVEITGFVTPICLPTVSAPLTEFSMVNVSLTIAGWGSDGKKAGSDTLQQVDIKVVPTDVCQPLYDKFGLTLQPTQICAGGDQKDSCRGDSGGPLMYADTKTGRYRVAGIVSLGSVKCGQGLPGVYTVVSQYRQWIINTIAARL